MLTSIIVALVWFALGGLVALRFAKVAGSC